MLIDAHAHVDYYKNTDQVLAEIREHQILTLSNAVHPASYRRTLEIAAQCPLVVPSFGVHPWWAAEYVDQLDQMGPLIEQSPLIGEIGLDYLWVDKVAIPAQQRIFDFFLAAASEQDKIVNLHTKDAEADVLALLRKHQIRRAIVHWYAGPLDVLQEMIEFGAYFTIGLEILTSKHIQAVAQAVPLDRLLTETDNPGAWEWLVKEPGRPSQVRQVLTRLAEVKQVPLENLNQTIAENLIRLAGQDTWVQPFLPRLTGQNRLSGSPTP